MKMSVKLKNRHKLKSKNIREIQIDIQKDFKDITISNSLSVVTGEYDGIKIILINSEPCFFYYEKRLVFTLQGINRFKPKSKYVIVDMGAVKFVTNGADVMAPGIIDVDKEILENDIVWICDEKNHKPLAVGFALISSSDMINQKKGKAIKIIHYVGDNLWNFVAKSL